MEKNNKKLDKIFKCLKDNWAIIVIILFSLILHILATCELGFNYNLNSDDISYINSGIAFLKTGKITMHGVVSAQIMPGMTFLIAFMGLIFGTGAKLFISLKILWMIMGIATVYLMYKTVHLYIKSWWAILPCLFFLTADYIWMDNLILTETPFILLCLLLIYHTLKLSLKPNKKDYILIVIYYIMAVFIRPNIGIFPIFLVVFLLLKKYDWKLLIKQCLIAGVVLLVFLTPWIYRNYKVFNKFIPLTYGTGNPLLLGTYQGIGYPLDEELNYKKNVDDKMSSEMKYYLDNPNKKDYMTKYYLLEKDGMTAKYRMNYWWKKDKKSMLSTYLWYKPKILIYSSFYWNEILGISISTILNFRKVELLLFIISTIIILINRKKIWETLFLGMIYISQIILYSYTFAFERYAQTLHFIRYIIIGISISIILKNLGNWRKKYESSNNNTSLQRRIKYKKYNN